MNAFDSLVVKQKIEWAEVVTGCETENRYNVYDRQGNKLFKAKERSGCCNRQCCGSCRAFDMEVRLKKNVNPAKPQFLHFSRPCAW